MERILMVTPRYLPDVGGVERHVHEVSRRLVTRGASVTILCTDRTGRRPRVDGQDGFEIRRVRAWPETRDYYLAPGLWREMARRRWDVIHVQSYHTFVAPLAMVRALSLRTPFVLTFHGGGHSSRVRHSLRATQRRSLAPLLRRADRLVGLARFEAEQYARELRIPIGRFVIIPNGVAALSSPPALPERVTIASIGRLERYKGHHRVLEALPFVLASRPEARLLIVGTGPEEAALRRQARRIGVADRVEMQSVPGDQPKSMAKLLERVSVVVNLSEFETQPLVSLEALGAGRPLVVAETSGLRELAAQGLARGIPLHSPPQRIADAILGELGGTRPIPALPTWDDCADRLLALYREVACAS